MKHYFQAIGAVPKIDPESGVIRGVSLIRKGNAEGHYDKKGRQEVVDETTLSQVYEYCIKAESIKVKADHGSGVLSTIGYVDNFARSADKVLGDFHIYETEPQKPRIFEIASKNPEHMGMSLEFEGKDEAKDNKCFPRCERVLAVALVSDPAANVSLFSAIPPEPEPNEKMEPENQPDEVPDKYEELSKKFDDLSNKYDELSKKFETPEPDKEDPAPATDPAAEPAKSDPEKTYEDPDAGKDDEVTKKAELAAERVFKKFAASLGINTLGKPGNSGGNPPAVKTYSQMVDDEAKNFDGDRAKAEAFVLSKVGKDESIKKAYAAHRQVKSA